MGPVQGNRPHASRAHLISRVCGSRSPDDRRSAGAKAPSLELTFLGTRGEIDLHSRRHRHHSSLLVLHDGARIMIDCGADWRGRLRAIAPAAIVLTHAHSDHAAGLADGAPCPVYAAGPTLDLINRYPIADPRKMPVRKPVTIGGLTFEAFPVRHSIRAPAVGYRVSAGDNSFFYLPDVAKLPDAANVLRGIDIYIGDGATIWRSMVRKKSGTLIGHATIAAQLVWCEQAGVGRAIFTHCGSAIVGGQTRRLNAAIRQLGCEHGVDARLACDGERLSVGSG